VFKQDKNIKKAKPFLKWAGGKGQLLETFSIYYPAELKNGKIENYYEPFLGGGSVFFDVAQKFDIKSAFLYDVNEELILVYRVIQQDVFTLIEILLKYKRQYEKLSVEKQNEYFYKTRKQFNSERKKINHQRYSENWIPRAAQIIFLNKTCFNGLFRFNSRGEFNTPVGKYKNPKIVDEDNLTKVSKLLGLAEIKKACFTDFEKDIKKDAFIYYDPPYRPLNKTSGFTAYSKNEFGDSQQQELARLFSRVDKKGALQMLSNSDPKNHNPDDNFFDELYSGFHIFRVPAKRMINSVASKRNAISEIIVTNYQVM
jgi:DNA adenine methylase